MGIGAGIFLIVGGAVLYWAIDFDMPGIQEDAMGLILLLAGLAVLVIAVVLKRERPEVGIGTGIALLVAGAILAFAIDFDMPYIQDYMLGTILMIAGLVASITTGVIYYQRRRAQMYGPPGYQQGHQPGYGQDPYYGQQQQPTRPYYDQGGDRYRQGGRQQRPRY